VGHEDHRGPEAFLQPLEFHAHLVAQEGVQIGERLVEEEDARLDDEGPGQGHALLLPTRELAGVPGPQRAEPDELERALDPCSQLGLRHPAPPQAEGDVLEHRHVREERIGLKHEADIAAVDGNARDVLAGQHDLPGVRLHQPRHHAEDGALAATGRAEEGKELARGRVDRHFVHGHDGAEGLAEPAYAQRRRGCQRVISRPQRSAHSGNFLATRSVSGKYMRCTVSP
jgi:hypothetical protein